MRTKDITFTAQGMKPDTRVFPFFDGVDVSAYVTPTGSSAGAALTTDAAGNSYRCISQYQHQQFLQIQNGELVKEHLDLQLVQQIDLTEGLVFSSAEADYTAKGMIQTVQGSSISTREVNIQRTTASDTSQIMGAVGTRMVRDETGPWFDPICQSFLVDQEDGYYITSVDLFFKTKSSSLPATVQIRTMVNGYPTSEVLPFAQIVCRDGRY